MILLFHELLLKGFPQGAGVGATHKRKDGFFYKKVRNTGKASDWVKLGKDKGKVEAHVERKKESKGSHVASGKVKSLKDRPHVKVGSSVRISASASSIGKGIVGKIKEVGHDFVRIADDAGKIFRVAMGQLEIAKSKSGGMELMLKAGVKIKWEKSEA